MPGLAKSKKTGRAGARFGVLPRAAGAAREREAGFWQAGWIAGFLVLAWFGQERLFARDLAPGLLLWAGAMVAALAAFRSQPDQSPEPEITFRREAWILGGILAVAVFFRFWRLATLPNGYFFDEGMNGLFGIRMLEDRWFLPIFGNPDAPRPALYFYMNAAALQLFGINAFATKLLPAFLGTVTVAMVYFIARRMVSRTAAFGAAFLLAVMRWHVNFSRINFETILPPLLAAATVYFLLRAVETRKREAYQVCGFTLALGIYSTHAAYLMPLVVGPYLLLQQVWQRKFFQGEYKNLIWFLGLALGVFAPLGYFALTHPDLFSFRSRQVFILNHVPPSQAAAAIWNNLKSTLLMFQYFGDCNGRHNLPELPMLDFGTGMLFALGLAWSLGTLRRPHSFLLSSWFFITVLPGFFTIEAPQACRCIGATIPIALLAGVGLERLWQGALALTRGFSLKPWLWVLVVLGLGWIGGQNAWDYFERQAKHPACWSEFSATEAAMGNYLHGLGPKVHAYISASSYNYPTIQFLAYPYLDAEPFRVSASIPSQDAGSKDVVYLLLPIHSAALEMLRFYYPGGKEQSFSSPFNTPLFTAYWISRKEIRAAQRLQARFTDAAGREISGNGQGVQGLEPPPGLRYPVRAIWRGSVRVPATRLYWFQLDGTGGAEIRVDQTRMPAAGLELAEGLHALEIRAVLEQPQAPPRLVWKNQGQSGWNLISGTALNVRETVRGLSGTYWSNYAWQGAPFCRRVDSLTSLLGADFPLGAPLSARWEGSLVVDRSGVYNFELIANELGWLSVDGKLLVKNPGADAGQSAAVALSAGRHAWRLDYLKKEGPYARVEVFWTAPGRAKQRLPFEALEP